MKKIDDEIARFLNAESLPAVSYEDEFFGDLEPEIVIIDNCRVPCESWSRA
ncbi:MAG TPA: hypothetical protein PK358_17715 [Spirochaetota bacterium]|nr:hypothetical protein [Spirochaetota bacterium]HPJ36678.1 hypothetical protein [Spirochaetota bacterium]